MRHVPLLSIRSLLARVEIILFYISLSSVLWLHGNYLIVTISPSDSREIRCPWHRRAWSSTLSYNYYLQPDISFSFLLSYNILFLWFVSIFSFILLSISSSFIHKVLLLYYLMRICVWCVFPWVIVARIMDYYIHKNLQDIITIILRFQNIRFNTLKFCLWTYTWLRL